MENNGTFTLRRRKNWIFVLEDEPEKEYFLPALSGLSYDEAEKMKKIGSMDNIVKQGPMIKEFILSYAPDLAKKDLGDMEYYEIFNAWGLSEGRNKLGESEASQSS